MEKKLHLGCGKNILNGWLNTDYCPLQDNVKFLDVRKSFPFIDNCFDYIFSEHMIEHLSYDDGINMIKESFRILKPGGKIRITTPNLQFLIDLYQENISELQKKYIEWTGEIFIGKKSCDAIMIINNFFRDWGHLFIYDKKTLTKLLKTNNFINISSWEINKSNDKNFQNLENDKRLPEGFLQLESFTLEAIKPSKYI